MILRPALRTPILAAAALLAGLLAACSEREAATPSAPAPPLETGTLPPTSSPPPAMSPASPSAAESSDPSGQGAAELDRSPLGVYEGTLPCTDCAGIRTELTLYLQPDTFVLRETYLGRPDGEKTLVTEGAWQAALGMEGDASATVIQLDPGKPESTRSFREDGGERLELLDPKGHRIESQREHALTRRVGASEGS